MASGGDVLKAVRKELAANSSLTALLGSGDMDTWIVRVNGPETVPSWFEGSGSALVSLSITGGWTTRNQHNSLSFPSLFVGVYVDPGRNTSLQREELYIRPRFLPIWDQLDTTLDVALGTPILWDDIRVVSSRRLNEWSVSRINETDGAYRSVAQYALQL